MKSTTIMQVVEKVTRRSWGWQAAAVAAALPLLGQGLQAATLQGEYKGNKTDWYDNNLAGWAELDYVPMRVTFPSGSLGSQPVTLTFPHFSGKTFGFEDLSDFAVSGNAQFAGAPALTMAADGNWTYNFTVNVLDNNPAEVTFLARLASGAHLYGGSSLQMKGSAGNIQIHKPLPGPGAPNLALSLSGPATVVQGGTVTYSMAYTNKAALDTGHGVQINQTLPVELAVDASSLPANARLVGNTLFWDLGDLAPGASGQLSLRGTVSPTAVIGANLVNFSQIVSAENDLNMADNEASLTTSVVCGGIVPAIVSQPAAPSACPGDPVVLSVSAVGPAGMTYQWYKDGTAVAGATGSSYTIASLGTSTLGAYTATVSSPCGSVTSQAAALSLNAEPPVTIRSGAFLSDGSFALSFDTGCGGSYTVEYTSDFLTWKPSPVTVPGQAAPAQWIDSGPPATESKPSAESYRFYRILRSY